MYDIAVPKGPLRSHITGGYKGIQSRNSETDQDCSQFSSDYDVLYHFPFLIMINPMNTASSQKSTALMNANGTLVIDLKIVGESSAPWSLFCLHSMKSLSILTTPFPNGVVPDTLGDLKQLSRLTIISSTIRNMTERLGALSNLNTLQLQYCELTYLPNLSGLSRLEMVHLYGNRLSKVDGMNGVSSLNIATNLFTDIPTLNNPLALMYLSMSDNPVKNLLKITSHVNLWAIDITHTNLSSIPPTIDRLQNLESLYLSNNQLFYLPTNMFRLPKLKYLDIQKNLFSAADNQTIRNQFKTTHPNMTLLM